ncbi:LysE/ArgO family amino acid transporter [Bacillus velezensis]|uniref:LysE/ArgO family amino acid transporter n=1 Tax=Bacillus velezensis TaxID=492670 RepID=UPI0024AF6F2D|nr:LysE/ArgO family amino acid transporter [Bacillus velezensis]MDQ8054985.1 LysE/ArgO family amino acid transporter [Bacillus velezensis]WHM03100.1 LysE/ArgO family amino acid transporter [Bacillus velezensis]
MLAALLNGIVLALGLILPLGAQNVFVFNQGVSQLKFRNALPVIITASLCDTFLILFAVLGVSLIVLTIPILKTIIFSVGLIFLIYMGWSIWKSDSANLSKKESAMPMKKQIMFALSVSLLNPHAIIDTVGVIGTNSLSYSGPEKIAFTAACIIVSWIWFFSLAIAGRIIGNIDSDGKFLRIINKVSAVIIWAVAVYITIQLVQSF